MLTKSNRWLAGFALFLVGELTVLFPWFLATGVSHTSLTRQLFGILLGLALGGLILLGGLALLWGKAGYASAALSLAGIEYCAIELYDGYAGGTPLFFVLGVVLLVVSTALAYYTWNRNVDTDEVNPADNLTIIGIVTLLLGTLTTVLVFDSSNPAVGLLVVLVGGVVAGVGRVAGRQSTNESA